MTRFTFDSNRTLQSIAYLLCKVPDLTMNYMQLIKMLYIAERECLSQYGYMITGDKVVALKYGPVLSETLNCIKQSSRNTSGIWRNSIDIDDHYNIKLVQNPGTGLLNRAIESILDSVFDRFSNLNEWDMVQITHQFPEWIANQPDQNTKQREIPVQSILSALNKEGMMPLIETNEKLDFYNRHLFDS